METSACQSLLLPQKAKEKQWDDKQGGLWQDPSQITRNTVRWKLESSIHNLAIHNTQELCTFGHPILSNLHSMGEEVDQPCWCATWLMHMLKL